MCVCVPVVIHQRLWTASHDNGITFFDMKFSKCLLLVCFNVSSAFFSLSLSPPLCVMSHTHTSLCPSHSPHAITDMQIHSTWTVCTYMIRSEPSSLSLSQMSVHPCVTSSLLWCSYLCNNPKLILGPALNLDLF